VPLARVELFLQFEGCLRPTTLWQLMTQKNMVLPAAQAVQQENEILALTALPPSPTKSMDSKMTSRRESTASQSVSQARRESSVSQSVSQSGGCSNCRPQSPPPPPPPPPTLAQVIAAMTLSQPSSRDDINGRLQVCVDALQEDLPAIEQVVMQISEDAAASGIKYFEISIDPYKFISKDRSQSRVLDVVRSVTGAFNRAEAATGAAAGVLLQYQKGNTEDAKELLKLCQDFREEGVVGLELAGYDFNIEGVLAEEGGSLDFLLFSPEDIAIFEEAQAAKVHRSVHAGEFGPSDVVFQAIERLGAERIVFGYSVDQDKALYSDVIRTKIHLATTPGLSCLNGSVGLDQFYHPVVQFAEDGANYSINSGLPIITGCWLQEELELMHSWGLTETHLAKATFNAARSAFLADRAKKDLLRELRKEFGMEDKVELEILINHNCGGANGAASEEDIVQKKLKVSF